MIQLKQYDSSLNIWLSVDPMADARSWVSPYSYVQKSPVMRVDPTGALDVYNTDEWELNKKTGEVKWVKESEKHQLFAVDENGNRTGESVTIKNRDVLDQFSTKGDLDRRDSDGNSVSKGHTTGSIDDVHKVFKFAADNSDVEWGVARYNFNKYAVWTSHDKGTSLNQSVKSPAQIGLNNVNASCHSHPNISIDSEMFSMGVGYNGGVMPRSDWKHKIDGYRPYHMYVYFPVSGNIYHISKYKVSNMGHINRYKDFYFGVLNHR